MSGRRSHPRYAVMPSPEGVLRVLRDVVVHSRIEEDLVIVSRDPGVLGELVSVRASCEGAAVMARVLESQLVMVEGAVRHRLRLRQMDGASFADGAESTPAEGIRADD